MYILYLPLFPEVWIEGLEDPVLSVLSYHRDGSSQTFYFVYKEWVEGCCQTFWRSNAKTFSNVENVSDKMVCFCTDNKPLPYTVCVCHIQSVCDRQSMSVTNRPCRSQTLDNIFCHRQSVSVTEVYVCQSHFVSVTHNMCPSQTVFFCHRQPPSVTENIFLSEKKYVCHRQYVSVTGKLYLSQTVCVCQSQSVSVTDIRCLSHTVFFLSHTVYVCHRQLLSVT